MIAFITYKEGGQFSKLVLSSSIRPKKVVELMKDTSCIIVFKCGMVHDSFIKPYLKTTWRHKFDGGRKAGRAYYKKLLELTEVKGESE